jgi:hypothetical protein
VVVDLANIPFETLLGPQTLDVDRVAIPGAKAID